MHFMKQSALITAADNIHFTCIDIQPRLSGTAHNKVLNAEILPANLREEKEYESHRIMCVTIATGRHHKTLPGIIENLCFCNRPRSLTIA